MSDPSHVLTPHVRRGDRSERARDPLEALVHALCALGPRPHGSAAHARSRSLLAAALLDAGALPYVGDDVAVDHPSERVNLLAVVPGRQRHCRPLLLATHYDGSAESPGAGDNAAAVAALVTLVTPLAARALERDVVVALVDGGDPSARPRSAPGRRRASADDDVHGLAIFLREQRRHDLKAAVLIDRVGHRVEAEGPPHLLVVGAESEARLPGVLTSLHGSMPTYAALTRREVGDAHAADALRAYGVPYLWLSGGRLPWHRGPGDTPDRLHRPSLDATTALLVALTERLSHTRLPGPIGEHDLSGLRRDGWGLGSPRADGRPSPADLRAAARRMGWA
jgi:hypothetical protein